LSTKWDDHDQKEIQNMPNTRLLAVVTAVMLSAGTPAAQAAYTFYDLQRIEKLILNREWNELRAYIEANPKLLRGTNPLANELRAFFVTYRQGSPEQFFSAPEAPAADLINQLVTQY